MRLYDMLEWEAILKINSFYQKFTSNKQNGLEQMEIGNNQGNYILQVKITKKPLIYIKRKII
jgi:hypothetical protein